MNHFIYRDNSKATWNKDHYDAPIIFECNANLLTEADKLLEDTLKINPAKKPAISAEVQKIPWYKKLLDFIHVM